MSRSAEIWLGRVRAAFTSAIGADVEVDEGFGPVQVDVPAEQWVEALRLARDELDCTFFDFLTAVDELADGFRIVCHVADHHPRGVAHLVVRTLVPRGRPTLPSAAGVYAGARWHERETHEMFGVEFTDGPGGDPLALEKLLLPDEFEGHPLRKEFVLASRVAKPWPGAKEPGEGQDTAHASSASSRRRAKPPGVPEPEQWGPREPDSEPPDPLAAATEAPAARPRRDRKATAPSAGRDRTAGGAAVAEEATDLSKATDPDDQAGGGDADG